MDPENTTQYNATPMSGAPAGLPDWLSEGTSTLEAGPTIDNDIHYRLNDGRWLHLINLDEADCVTVCTYSGWWKQE